MSFHRLQPALVVQHAGELGEPRPQPVGDAVGHPEADLRLALHAVLPAIRLLDADAEDADDGLAAHGGAEFLAVLPVRPRRGQPAAGLPVGDQRGRQLADPLHVQRTGRAAAGVRDDAGVGIDLADLGVPEPPQVEEPLLTPEDVGAPRRVLRVAGAGKLVPDCGAEVLPAMLAVAHPGAVPAVDEDGVHPVARHDLPLHLGHELEVVGAEPARHPHLRRGPMPARLALGVHRDPVRDAPPARRRRSRADRCAR